MKKYLIIFIAVILIVGGIIACYFVFGSYSEGHRSGRIIKISRKGIMFKTYEGQLDVGGLISGGDDGAATTIWDFSIKDEEVVEALEAAVDKDTNVKLHYKEKFYQLFFLGDTKYFVDKVITLGSNSNDENKEDKKDGKFEITDEMLE